MPGALAVVVGVVLFLGLDAGCRGEVMGMEHVHGDVSPPLPGPCLPTCQMASSITALNLPEAHPYQNHLLEAFRFHHSTPITNMQLCY